MRASARRNDFVVGISTFGNSHNDIEGIRSAKLAGAYTLALTGRDGGKIKNVADYCIKVNSNSTPIIQESHIAIIHMICYAFDTLLEKLQ